jgi:CheY-like chemotaxis protein
MITPDVPDKLIGDPGRLRQILINLVGNALKFTEKGRVAVSIGKESNKGDKTCLHFAIQDTGIGIPLEKQATIFNVFTQADDSTTRRFGGTGLGLSISRQLVELMGSQIWLESEPGKGSTFHFTVCFELVTQTPLEVADATKPVIPAFSKMPRKTIQILVAEDNVVNQKLAVRMLEKEGHQVVLANNGREAVEKFKERHFDLILMDCMMPELDGFEATRCIRQSEKNTNAFVPIVALTASAMKGDRELCIEAGMNDYLSKPIKREQLLEKISQLVG